MKSRSLSDIANELRDDFNLETRELIETYIQKMNFEQESLVAKFIQETGLKPSEICLVTRQTPNGPIFYPDAKFNHFTESKNDKQD